MARQASQPEGGLLRRCGGALALAAVMVVSGLLVAAAVAAAASARPQEVGPPAPAAPQVGEGAAPPGERAPGGAGTAPAPTPHPQAAVTPGPGRPLLAVATPDPQDARASVRAVRAGQPRQQRPLSDRGSGSPTPARGGAPTPGFSLPMPVPGRWLVTCGYHCGLHDGLHTYGLDLVRLDGPTAGTPVRAPVAGRIVAVVDGTVAYCGGRWVTGIAAGSVLVLEFPLPDGRSGRLRLVHLEGSSIPPQLRPRSGPVAVAAGTYLGSLAYIGPGCAHLHLDLAALERGVEVPLPLAIAGRALPDCGASDCWTGTVLP